MQMWLNLVPLQSDPIDLFRTDLRLDANFITTFARSANCGEWLHKLFLLKKYPDRQIDSLPSI